MSFDFFAGSIFFLLWKHSKFATTVLFLLPLYFIFAGTNNVVCYNRCPDLLEPAGRSATRFTPQRRKLHPVGRRAASNVVQTPGVATMYAGATTGDQGSCKKGVSVFADVFFIHAEYVADGNSF